MRKVKTSNREGKTLLAIKEYRDGTGKTLKECCDYVIEVLKPKYYRDPTPKPDISNMFAEVGAKAFNNR
jgi:ribosomal protein L7/L12